MDIEQLKLVIEAVKSVSGDAQSVAIWWIILDELVPVIAWLIAGFGAYKIGFKIITARREESEDCRRMKELRDILHPNGGGYVCNSDYQRMLKRIRELEKTN